MLQKILVIDDDSRIHDLVRAQFDEHHFEIFSSHTGEVGFQAAVDKKPDLILLDVDLPDAQGFEICRRLKIDRATCCIPVIFLTGTKSLEATIFGLECGACDYLVKPFHPGELQARVRAALRNRLQNEILNQQSILDEPTGMFNRKYFELRLDACLRLPADPGVRSAAC